MKRTVRRQLGALALCAVLALGLVTPASAARFADVPAGYWAADAIERCADLGFFRGRGPGHFGVGQAMSRGSFVVVLTRFFGWETAEAAGLPFTDVPADAWYAPALATALRHGAVTLQSPEFRPTEPLTREELAVSLVRGLGYTPLSGMAQERDLPFTDVTSNRGYIAMALDLGLVNGTTATTFSPSRVATREQVAVMLMRLYDKLHSESSRLAILRDGAELPDLTGFDTVALYGGKLVPADSSASLVMAPSEEARTAMEAAVPQGARRLLYVTGGPSILTEGRDQNVAALLAGQVEQAGLDGLFLDVPGLRRGEHMQGFNALVKALRTALGQKQLYLAVEAPCVSGHTYEGYDYAQLGRLADRLVVRVHSHADHSGQVAVAPVEPLEEVYYGLRQLRRQVPAEKLVLWMSTDATVWGQKTQVAALTGLEVQALLEEEEPEVYYSRRYGCAYFLTKLDRRDVTVWYPNGESVSQRVQLSRLFGADGVALSSVGGVTAETMEGLE